MKKPVLSAATEAAAAVTVATAQREVQPAVTDSQLRVVSHSVLQVNIFSITMNEQYIFFIIIIIIIYCYRYSSSKLYQNIF